MAMQEVEALHDFQSDFSPVVVPAQGCSVRAPQGLL